MGQPQPLGRVSDQQDSVSTVLGQISEQQSQIEKRLDTLRDRLQLVPRPPETTQVANQSTGLVGAAVAIRNTGSRVMNLLDAIESLI